MKARSYSPYLSRVGLKVSLCHCGTAITRRFSLASRGRAYMNNYCTACGCVYGNDMKRVHQGQRCPEKPMINKGLFTSARGNWRTPRALYSALDAEFHFDDDPCPSQPVNDGLSRDWGQCAFLNPPYGKQIGAWLEKAVLEWRRGKTVVALIPSRTDTRWFHDYILPYAEIRFIKGRLHFDDGPGPAPFPSAVVIWRKPEPRL